MNPTTSNYNPDELVTLTGSKGTVKQVKRSELPNYNLPTDYISQADTYAKSVKQGTIGVNDVPEKYRSSALQNLQSSGFTPESAQEIKIQADAKKKSLEKNILAKSAKKDLDLFETNFNEAGLKGKVLGRLPSGSGLSPESADFDSQRNALAYTLAGVIANQTGRGISDADVKNFMKLLPTRSDTTKEAQNKMRNIKAMISYRDEQEEAPSLIKDSKKDNFISPGSNLAKDNGVTLGDVKTELLGMKDGIGAFAKSLPNQVTQNIQENPMSLLGGPQEIAGNLLADNIPTMAKGMAESYKTTFSNTPEAAEYRARHPIETVTNLLPPIIPGAGAAKASRVGIAGTKLDRVAQVADKTALPAITTTAPKVSDTAARMFASSFSVPQRMAARLKPLDVAKEIVADGIHGNFEKMTEVSSKITGQNGILSRAVRDTVGGIKGEVNYDNAISSAQKALDKIPQLKPKDRQEYLRQIRSTVTQGQEIGKSNALDVFDTVKSLEDEGHAYLNSSTAVNKNLLNEKIGDAYLGVADDLKKELELAIEKQNLVDAIKTPELIAELEAISPNLARKFIEAKTVGDLRRIQSPYVRLNQMIQYTNDATTSPVKKLAAGISTSGGAVAGGAVAGIPGAIAGGLVGRVAQPIIESVVEGQLPRITSNTARGLQKVGSLRKKKI